MVLQILHLEDSPEDAFLIKRALLSNRVEAEIAPARNRSEFIAALENRKVDLILADNGLPGFSGLEALEIVRYSHSRVPVICLSGSLDERHVTECLNAGADEFISKDHLPRLIKAVHRIAEKKELERSAQGMARLVETVQELSLVRDLSSIMAIVRSRARELTGADGATFVLREGDNCFYADEDAIAPLWKGQRFPMSACISGWVMLNREPAVIEDIFADPRIPADAYRPTFVKSLAVVPIREESPIGAIGIYWAQRRPPATHEVELLQALANTTSVAIENVRIYSELEHRVQERTAQLEAANQELESFSYAVSHDLGAPLRTIRGFSDLVLKECSNELSEKGKLYLTRVHSGTQHMRQLMDDLLQLSRVARTPLVRREVNLSDLARTILSGLAAAAPERKCEIQIADGITAEGDLGLLRIVMENLLSNAWKYTGKKDMARIEFGVAPQPDGSSAFHVRDNGAGFDMQYAAAKLFQPFGRLHSPDEFTGSGVGLSTVQRIIRRHGGRIWAEAAVENGATFYFTLGQP